MFKDYRSRNNAKGSETQNVVAMPRPDVTPVEPIVEVDEDLQAHLELKSRLHETLLERLNLSVIDRVEKPELRRQIAALVTQMLEALSLIHI